MRHPFSRHWLHRQTGKISDRAAHFKHLRTEPFYLLDVTADNEVLNCLTTGGVQSGRAAEMLKPEKWCAMKLIFEESKRGEAIFLQSSQGV
jgi:hypothetical protein